MCPLWLSIIAAFLVAPTAAQAREFVAANVHQPHYPTVQAMAHMARLVDERTAGRLHITVVSQGRASEPFIVGQVRTGEVALAAVNIAHLSDIVPATAAFILPYLFESNDHLRRTVEGSIGAEILAALERRGLVGLAFYDAGDRSFYTTAKPIRTVADLRDMTVRIQRWPLSRAMIRATGAKALPLPYEKTFDALKTGLVDAAEDNWPAFMSSRQYEIAKVYSVTRHTRAPEILIFSKPAWDQLSPEDQETVRAAALQSVRYQNELRQVIEASQLQTAAAVGVKMVDDVDTASLVNVMEPLCAALVAEPAAATLVDRIRALTPGGGKAPCQLPRPAAPLEQRLPIP